MIVQRSFFFSHPIQKTHFGDKHNNKSDHRKLTGIKLCFMNEALSREVKLTS